VDVSGIDAYKPSLVPPAMLGALTNSLYQLFLKACWFLRI